MMSQLYNIDNHIDNGMIEINIQQISIYRNRPITTVFVSVLDRSISGCFFPPMTSKG